MAQRLVIVCAFGALAAACSTAPETTTTSGGYKIGEPYEEAGVWYHPREQPDYDETGIASWYGGDFHGRHTANGEVFDSGALTAAHPTLPMPVNVRVTNLENGRSLVLRVNDRGPFVRGRIIDVSERAARLLGFYEKGTARVRVTFLARADGQGATPAETSTAIAAVAAPTKPVEVAALDPVAAAPLAQSPQKSPAPDDAAVATQNLPPPMRPSEASDPSAAAMHFYVQAGAFAERENAERLVDRLSVAGNLTISSIDRNGQLLYRVRIGPFDDVGAADAALARLPGLGESDAKIVVDQ